MDGNGETEKWRRGELAKEKSDAHEVCRSEGGVLQFVGGNEAAVARMKKQGLSVVGEFKFSTLPLF